MPTLLQIDSAAHQSSDSVTRRLGALFVETWAACHPGGEHRHRDLIDAPAPPLDSAYCRLGRRLERDGLVPPDDVARHVTDAAEAATWSATLPLIQELLEADVVLLAAPMYNFGIPAALKAWIDRVTFPGVLNPPITPTGPLTGKDFVLVTASGGCYGPGTPREAFNFHGPHLRAWLTAYRADPNRIHVIGAEATIAGLVPALAELRPVGEATLRSATQALTDLAAKL
jgi:FMN-dependent NADH-azoreductase